MHRGLLSPTGDYTSYLPIIIIAAIGIAILAFALYKRKDGKKDDAKKD